MYKFSVKKPLTVFVAVIAVLVLGVVAYFRMTPDLLPNMDFPYVVIMTTYPGASPEKVETEVTKPLEQAMSTLENIKEVSSTSRENVSMIMLEFYDSVNMDTIGVDIQQQIATQSAGWADVVGTPYVLKINPSVLPVQVAALSMDGMDNVQLAEFLNDTLLNKLEGIPGVARITTTGMIQQELHVVLDQTLIDQANEKVMAAINKKLDDKAEELEDQKEELESSKAQMESAKGQMSAGVDALLDGDKKLQAEKEKLLASKAELDAAKQKLEITYHTLKMLSDRVDDVTAARDNAQQRLDALQKLQEQKAQIQQLRLEIQEIDQRIAELEEGTSDTASAENELETLKTQKIQLEADLAMKEAAYNAGLAAAGVSEEELDTALANAAINAELAEQAVSAIDQLLASQNMDRETLKATVAELETQLAQINEAEEKLESGLLSIEDAQTLLEEQKLKGLVQMSTAAGQLAAGASSLEMALTQIETGLETIEDSREDALRQSDLNEIITMDMVKQILTAQNFAMPAGYVQEDGVSYMVSVGDEITDLDTLENLLLFDMNMEGVDPIYLKDVAVVTLTDNRDETYAKLDGQGSVMLRFEKQSTYSTAGTTDNIDSRFRELEKEYPGLHFVSLMDQGDYIYMVVNSILKNLFLGALFSVLILFLFLRDIRPTFITLCSIPISVVFAIVLMYFSGVTLNMIPMSALAIAVGMLVDN